MSSSTSTPHASTTNSSNQAQARTMQSMGISFSKKNSPNPSTIADGYSLSDERQPITGPELDYDYSDDLNPGMRNPVLERQKVTMLLHQSHPGEHRKDFGEVPITLMPQVTTWVLCAAINSCNLGYDIGLNASASVVMQNDLELSDIQLHLFISSMNLFAIVGALFAYTMSDYFGRRHAFAVSQAKILGVSIEDTVMSNICCCRFR
jgi:Sugar (and other) transporter